MAELVLKLLGILFGVLARTLVPYLRKLKQGKVKKFWNGYWIQAVASLALGVMTTLLIFPQFNVAKPGVGLEASVKLFCLAFGFGFGCNSIIAEAAKWAEKGKNKGSHNYTFDGLRHNNETSLLLKDREKAKRTIEYFAQIE